jgi:hypothetical protein
MKRILLHLFPIQQWCLCNKVVTGNHELREWGWKEGRRGRVKLGREGGRQERRREGGRGN